MHKDYYSQLVTLYEATKVKKIDQEVVNEAPVMGEPVIAKKEILQQKPAPEETGDISEDPELDDANYLNDPNLSSVELIPDTPEQKRKEKLFELFSELMNYSTVFYDDLEKIDGNLLDKEKIGELRENKKRIITISEKLRKYIKEDFLEEKYEKSLYIYILLRTELITIIKLLRQSFELNKIDDKETKKN